MQKHVEIEIKSIQHQTELQSIKWQKKRQRILTKTMHFCKECKSNENLEVHHLYYINGHKLWEYPDKALIVLCRVCHQKWHDTHEIEYRDTVWSKNKEYKPPLKGDSYKRKARKKVDRPAVVSDKQKIKLQRRDKIKRKLLKASIPQGWLRVFNETRNLTIDELKVFLIKESEVLMACKGSGSKSGGKKSPKGGKKK